MTLIKELSITSSQNGEPIPVKIVTRPRAKNVTLRIDPKLRCAVLAKPPYIPLKKAQQFLTEKQDWLTHHFASLPPINTFKNNETIHILGQSYTITSIDKGDITWIQDRSLYVKGRDEQIHGRVKRFLKKHAKENCTTRAHFYAKQLNTTFSNITIRDTTSRWGSCSSSGNLSFSWRLIMAPKDVFNYVVAHEVAHLREMNHSAQFWQLVASVEPEYKRAKEWLKKHGSKLHSYS